jgi:hypothetical protein
LEIRELSGDDGTFFLGDKDVKIKLRGCDNLVLEE